ncbi:MAG: (Fe-S)-binding protein [Deltaproteobacteria bacterium]|nr:(Fe-S)-binding protein [Deltaproteobacteria bacterium]
METILKQIAACAGCEACLKSCPTYSITGERLFTPKQRLQTVEQILEGQSVSDPMIESLYNCTKCMACESVCPAEIKVSSVVNMGRQKLVERGLAPLPRGKQIIEGLLKTGNAVGGRPEKRLSWLPEPFAPSTSETLLFLGCLPSYLVKDAASASYLLLKRMGIDFMILEEEGCCGTYIYEAGQVDLAREYFKKNVERFKSLGIQNMIVPCNGCLKCFKYFYPEVLGDFPIKVSHLLEVVYTALKENPSLLNQEDRPLVYQDACRLARVEGLTEEPRELLSWCATEVKDMQQNREQTPCCGAGGGVRSLYGDLSGEMSARLLDAAPGQTLVSPCPFCTFQLRRTAIDKKIDKEIKYISSIVLDALNGNRK